MDPPSITSVAVYARRGEHVLRSRTAGWRRGCRSAASSMPARPRSRRPSASCARRPGSRARSDRLAAALDGVPPGLIGYEEHVAGAKGMHIRTSCSSVRGRGRRRGPGPTTSSALFSVGRPRRARAPSNRRSTCASSGSWRSTPAGSDARIRQHVKPRDLFFETFRGERPVLDPTRVIEVEIGCADARFLFERAARDPSGERTRRARDPREDFVDLVNKRARAAKLPVHAVFCQAQLHMDEILLATPRVALVYINFPDPWFKRRHRTRRMVDATLVDAIARITEPGAEVFVQSDVWSIALDAMDVFELRDDRFGNDAGEWTSILARGQSVRRAVVARAARRGPRAADLADQVSPSCGARRYRRVINSTPAMSQVAICSRLAPRTLDLKPGRFHRISSFRAERASQSGSSEAHRCSGRARSESGVHEVVREAREASAAERCATGMRCQCADEIDRDAEPVPAAAVDVDRALNERPMLVAFDRRQDRIEPQRLDHADPDHRSELASAGDLPWRAARVLSTSASTSRIRVLGPAWTRSLASRSRSGPAPSSAGPRCGISASIDRSPPSAASTASISSGASRAFAATA